MSRKTKCRFWTGMGLRALCFLSPAMLAVWGAPAIGQVLPSIQQLQQMQQLGQQPAVAPDPAASLPVVMQPDNAGRLPPLPPSRLEQIMSQRAGAPLRQFGYDQLGGGRAVTVPQTGAVQDDYILGAGDEVVVSLRGTENNDFRITIDRNGQALVPRLSPIPATGRSFGSFRRDVEAAVGRAYVATSAFVSVGRVRQISVLVSGEVNNPGQRLITGLSSVVDALLLSGGVRKTGSLRAIRIERGGRTYNVDLYSVLTAGGRSAAMRLADGDRILVPLLGQTAAISGLVRQPGIYELPPRSSTISAAALLDLAGGREVRGLYRMSVLRIEADGRSNLQTIEEQSAVLRDSEILFVQLGADQVVNQATLSGGTGLAGNYAIMTGTRLSQMLRAPGAMGSTPYSLFGLIVRRDPQTLLRTLIPIAPVAVLAGREDLTLQGDDLVRPFQATEARLLDFVMRSYLQRLAQADAAMRNPLASMQVGSSAVTEDFNALQDQTEQGQLAAAQSFIINVPSETQRRTIIALLEQPAPGSPAASARADQMRRQREALAVARPPVSGVPGANPAVYPNQNQSPGQPGQMPGQMSGQTPDRNIAGQPGGDLASAEGLDPAQNFQNMQLRTSGFASNREVQTFGQLVRQLDVDPLVLINFLVEHRARLDGAVRGPGDYLIGPSVVLSDLVSAAGGTINWADQKGVELISNLVDRENGKGSTLMRTLPLGTPTLSSYVVRPGDQLRFAQIDTGVTGSVTIQGEVRNPGTFSVLRGDRLSDVLSRAGGLTEIAYPAGTIFLRRSAAQQEREGYQRAAREVQDQLVVAMTRVGNSKIDPTTFTSMQVFVQELRQQQALGRISVVADPSILASRPELDPLLETGDVIYLPQRPTTISVMGQVLQPGSYTYGAGLDIEDYISRAGGMSSTADGSQAFVVLPDGSARRVGRSWFRYDSNVIPPGSVIVIPRDVTPLDLRQTVIDITQILSQLAVAIASVAVISNQ
jgi:protein involved in polysaccharide export with SLBB domain